MLICRILKSLRTYELRAFFTRSAACFLRPLLR
jgi:hypothetical protein